MRSIFLRLFAHRAVRYGLSILAFSGASTTFLTACVPVLLTTQPRTNLIVTDSASSPIEGADVSFATFRGPFGPRSIVNFITDSQGEINIDRETEWHTFVFLPDGSTWYDWYFCVEKSGYKAQASAYGEIPRIIEITLEESSFVERCEWPDNPSYPAHIVSDD